MSTLVDSLYLVKYNPFIYGPHIASFYSHLKGVEQNFLLSQLIIPLCSNPKVASKIVNSTSRSSFWTIFANETKKAGLKRELFDLQERIDLFKNLTAQSMQYAVANDWISINAKDLNVLVQTNSDKAFSTQKVAANLGKLFSGHSVLDVYALLGVVPR